MKKTNLMANVNTQKNVLVKNFENEVKNYLVMTTDYTKCDDLDGENFKVDTNNDYVEIKFYESLITFHCTGAVKALFADNEFDIVKVRLFTEILLSRDEIWMMYDNVFNNKKKNKKKRKEYLWGTTKGELNKD